MLFIRALLSLALVAPLAVLAAPAVPEPAQLIAEKVTPNKDGDLSAFYTKGGRHPTCDPLDVTRVPETCQCIDPFIQLSNARHSSGVLQPCVCSDVINAVPYVTGRIGRRRATCVCIGSYQEFNVNKDKCVCVGGYTATIDKKGKLTCQPPKPTKTSHSATPSATKTQKARHPHWRRVYDAAARNDLVEIAFALDCNAATEHVVEIDGEWTCRADSLTHCGVDEFDCSAMPGVDVVHCVAGQCVAESCYRMYTLTEGTCERKAQHSWFEVQAAE